ncbi:MAG: ATP-binding protein [Fibrobacteria bacterium]|nr:ATP-binding protein [Fibrobacteria bacterium]
MIIRNISIEKYLLKKKSLFLIGARGTGKSTFIKSQLMADNHPFDFLYIDLLQSKIFTRYLNYPSVLRDEIIQKLSQSKDLCVIIDEIQKIPQLLDEVHSLIEEYKGKLFFILTGSSARKLKKANANMLAGRAFLIHFPTLQSSEIDFTKHLNSILQYGLLPEVFMEPDDSFKQEFLENYCFTYLKEEIQQEALTRNIESFSKFLELAAQANGAIVNFSKISKQIRVASKTVKEYYSILEDTLIAIKIPAWEHSMRKQLQKAAKYYLFDNGVLNALNGELRTELKTRSYRYGNLFENLIINEVVKRIHILKLSYNIYHYRTNTGQEIDLILEERTTKKLIAIEMKSDDGSTPPNKREFNALIQFKDEFPNAELYVWCLTPQAFSRYNILFLPFLEGLAMLE